MTTELDWQGEDFVWIDGEDLLIECRVSETAFEDLSPLTPSLGSMLMCSSSCVGSTLTSDLHNKAVGRTGDSVCFSETCTFEGVDEDVSA